MPDYYQLPAMVLTALLLPAFGHLYFRFRDTRSLLWFLGFLFATLRMLLLYRLGTWDFVDGDHPWLVTAGQAFIQLPASLRHPLYPAHGRLHRDLPWNPPR